MFKELFITGLLSFTVGSTPLKEIHKPKQELNSAVNSFMYGYCFTDNLNYDKFYDYVDTNGDVEWSTEYNSALNISSGNGLITCYNGDSTYGGTQQNTFYYNDIQYWNFNIYLDSDDWVCFEITIHFVSPLVTVTYKGAVTNDSTWYYFDYNSQYFFKYSALYFKNRYISTDDLEYEFYRLLFANSNEYVENYTGWYTFNGNVTNDYYFSCCGLLTVNNYFYDKLQKTTTQFNGGAWQVTLGAMSFGDNDTWYYLYKDGKFADRSITQCYFTNTLLPTYLKDRMSRSGMFAYVPTVNNYSFGDMLFSIMDSPVYMLQQLFSFELFGIQFYVAFMSIVTVLLIVFVVRKLV